MKDETQTWISYAEENLDAEELALAHEHLNACLQNTQQAVEKYLKAFIVEHNLYLRWTHSIRELVGILADQGIATRISEDEMDLMDTIYIPSKYPVYSALPYTNPDVSTGHVSLKIARDIRDFTLNILQAEESL